MIKRLKFVGQVVLAWVMLGLAFVFVFVFWIARIDVNKSKGGDDYDETPD